MRFIDTEIDDGYDTIQGARREAAAEAAADLAYKQEQDRIQTARLARRLARAARRPSIVLPAPEPVAVEPVIADPDPWD